VVRRTISYKQQWINLLVRPYTELV